MSTSAVGAGVDTGAVTQENNTYRRYVKLGTTVTDGETKTIIKEFSILRETEKKEPEKLSDGTPNPFAGYSVNWAAAERDGLAVFNQNEVVSYAVKTWGGAEFLIPDEAQRLYIFNLGLGSYQTSRAQAFMKANVENAQEPTPLYNDTKLDLRIGIGEEGEYSINKAPSRRSMTDLDKLIKQLTAMGIAPDKQAAVLAALAASQTSDQEDSEAVSV